MHSKRPCSSSECRRFEFRGEVSQKQRRGGEQDARRIREMGMFSADAGDGILGRTAMVPSVR